MNVYLREDIADAWQGTHPLQAAFALQGEVFREAPGRRTMRVHIGEQAYFVKLHYGVGWGEIVKNWLQFKRPIIGAENEYLALTGLAEAGIPAPRPAAFAMSGGSPASRRSFVLSDPLEGYISLEDVVDSWLESPPDLSVRRATLRAVARFAGEFHRQGFIHRDFYVCHILAKDVTVPTQHMQLAVLDLHRARRFARIPQRWLKRDLAALLFSVLDLNLTRREWLRFVREYSGRSLHAELGENRALWQAVHKRAWRLYREGLRKGIVKNLARQEQEA